jgi:hypothetical protein
MQVSRMSTEKRIQSQAMLPLKNSKIGRPSKCDSCFKFWQLRRDSAALQRRLRCQCASGLFAPLLPITRRARKKFQA